MLIAKIAHHINIQIHFRLQDYDLVEQHIGIGYLPLVLNFRHIYTFLLQDKRSMIIYKAWL